MMIQGMIRAVLTMALAISLAACGGQGGNETGPTGVVATKADSSEAPVAVDGLQEIHTADGGRMQGQVVRGERDGQWTAYFPSGIIRSRADYRAGKRNGPVEVFHDNGMPYYTGQYADEVKVGTWLFFDPQGKELKRVTYDSLGVLIEEK